MQRPQPLQKSGKTNGLGLSFRRLGGLIQNELRAS